MWCRKIGAIGWAVWCRKIGAIGWSGCQISSLYHHLPDLIPLCTYCIIWGQKMIKSSNWPHTILNSHLLPSSQCNRSSVMWNSAELPKPILWKLKCCCTDQMNRPRAGTYQEGGLLLYSSSKLSPSHQSTIVQPRPTLNSPYFWHASQPQLSSMHTTLLTPSDPFPIIIYFQHTGSHLLACTLGIPSVWGAAHPVLLLSYTLALLLRSCPQQLKPPILARPIQDWPNFLLMIFPADNISCW